VRENFFCWCFCYLVVFNLVVVLPWFIYLIRENRRLREVYYYHKVKSNVTLEEGKSQTQV
jgi:hypothetical protein